MTATLGQLLLLFVPMILAGTTNMVFMKTGALAHLHRPMDGGRVMADGKRIFGDNKTWKGFFGMIAFAAFWVPLAVAIAKAWPALGAAVPARTDVSFLGSVAFGAAWGLAYVLAELPNSFIKRRIDIPPGKNVSGAKGFFFLIVDQIDSVIGCALLLPFVSDLGLVDLVVFSLLGVAVHYFVSLCLYLVRLKNQAG